MTSGYQQGDVISLTFGFLDRPSGGNYQIIRVLPASETGQRQYRVRGADGRERAIEYQIRSCLKKPFGNLG